MKIGFLQFKPLFGEVNKNISKIQKLTRNIKADLLVMPELSNSGYIFTSKKEAFELAEPVPTGAFTRAIIEIARKKKMYIVCGIAEREGKNVYNSAFLAGPKGFIDTYKKAHLFYNEKLWFKKSNTPFKVHTIKGVKIGMMICFDWFFPESMRVLSLKGAQVICHCANLVMPYCQKAMVTRCLENRVFAVTANRTGQETRGKKSLHFTGMSQITGINGEILSTAGASEETIKIVTINPRDALNKNINPKNNIFKERRVEFYRDLA
ncbi:MAG: acyltransferase [Elusimicrobia bacterium RIFOXYA2_FULL_39_19]|nr:MAG: acyltransferase [Elusimicrobia bacterium RIFOXYA2_FULL_39_19]